jgi:hypothetical protein
MAWPAKLDDVVCNDFPREVLPYLVQAIDDKRVKWIEQGASCYEYLGTAQFDYLGVRYELAEWNEVVISIKKLGKSPALFDEEGEPEGYKEAMNGLSSMTFIELREAARKGEALERGPDWGVW